MSARLPLVVLGDLRHPWFGPRRGSPTDNRPDGAMPALGDPRPVAGQRPGPRRGTFIPGGWLAGTGRAAQTVGVHSSRHPSPPPISPGPVTMQDVVEGQLGGPGPSFRRPGMRPGTFGVASGSVWSLAIVRRRSAPGKLISSRRDAWDA